MNAGDETAPLSVHRDATRGKRSGGSGRARHIPHLLQPSLLASVNPDLATVPALSE